MAKIRANLDAVRLVKELEQEGRPATTAEQAKLVQYTGWGGLASVFKQEHTYYQQVKEALTEQEYEAARASTMTSFYTPPAVVASAWDIAVKLGFDGGNVLEPSAGIGHFFGLMPPHLRHRSALTGVEIDPISGRILKALYPGADVRIEGYEQQRIRNNSLDLVITNVPFGQIKVYDPYEKDLSKAFDIHDYFIAKSIRKLKPGGLGIFISSTSTLDTSKKLREWVTGDGNSDFIGAVRLNHGTFKNTAGTETSADLIVIRKRDENGTPDYAVNMQDVSMVRRTTYPRTKINSRGEVVNEDIPARMIINRYFQEHPEYLGGVMKFGFEDGKEIHPTEQRCSPVPEIDQQKVIADFIAGLPSDIYETPAQKVEVAPVVLSPDGTKEGGLTLINGRPCLIQYGQAVEVDWNTNKVAGHSKIEALKDYLSIKEAINTLLEAENGNTPQIEELRRQLNSAYNRFVSRYGTLSENKRINFLRDDVDFPSVAAIETVTKKQKPGTSRYEITVIKSDIFNRRVIDPAPKLQAETVEDGIKVSLYHSGKLDIPYISELIGRPETDIRNEILERRLAFIDPQTGLLVERSEYLSGNVRRKLALAEQSNEAKEYDANIDELRRVVPRDLPLHLLKISLGSTWIPVEAYERFFEEKFEVKAKITRENNGKYTAVLKATNNSADINMGMPEAPGSTLALNAMNNTQTTIYTSEYDPITRKSKRVKDPSATAQAAAKQTELDLLFEQWCKAEGNPFAEEMVENYNDQFNGIIDKEIDVSGFDYFPGASHVKKPRKHQKEGTIRALNGATLLAHEVGTGKTITLISTAMEMRRLGIARKPCIVVQRATYEQFVGEIKSLYPAAKVLVPSAKDLTQSQRQQLFAKIAYNDWDIVVLYHGYLDSIPDDPDRVNAYIDAVIQEKLELLDSIEANNPKGGNYMASNIRREVEMLEDSRIDENGLTLKKKKKIKDIEKKKANVDARTRRLLDRRTDKTLTFEKLGIDALLVDEAHTYKKLGFSTSLQNIKGIDPTASQKAQSMRLKSSFILNNNDGKNVVFATGTPISNTMAEMWTFMRYLLPESELAAYDLKYFDSFVNNFGSIEESAEFNASGKFKVTNRFASYSNVPELLSIWKKIAHTVLTEEVADLREGVGTPLLEGGKPTDMLLEQTAPLKGVMKGIRATLERYDKMKGREKRENSHIPLVMFGLAKRAAIDVRLIDSALPDDPNSKLNVAVSEIVQDLTQTESYKGTVAVFCDSYQSRDHRFNVFTDMKNKLIASGVPASQIAIINDYNTDEKRKELFINVNKGDVRVVMGTTEKLGVGVNMQERLHMLVHMDVPIRPMDYQQRNGRILRQGNIHLDMKKPVRILRLGVKQTLDVTGYQRLQIKEKFIQQIMKGDMSVRMIEEDAEGSDANNFSQMMAELSGSQAALALSVEQNKLRKLLNALEYHKQNQIYIANEVRRNNNIIATTSQIIDELKAQQEQIRAVFPDRGIVSLKIGNREANDPNDIHRLVNETYTKRIEAEVEKLRKNAGLESSEMKGSITVNGRKFSIRVIMEKEYIFSLENKFRIVKTFQYQCEDFPDLKGEVAASLDNVLAKIGQYIDTSRFDKEIADRQSGVERARRDNEVFKPQLGKPFPKQAELESTQERVETLQQQMAAELAEIEAKEEESQVEAIDMDAELEAAEETDADRVRYRDGDQFDTENTDVEDAVLRLADALHTSVQIVRGEKQVADTETERRRRQTAGGWYDPRTGQVYIVPANLASVAEAEATVLHEVVGHKGLRNVLGKRFGEFLDKTYNGLDGQARRRADEYAAKERKARPGLSENRARRIGTEEYLARLAEGNITPGRFARIIGRVRRILREVLGIPLRIDDRDIAYMLWLSRHRLSQVKTAGDAVHQASDRRRVRRILYGEGVRFREDLNDKMPAPEDYDFAGDYLKSVMHYKKREATRVMLSDIPPTIIYDKHNLKRRAQLHLLDSTLPVRLLQEEITRRGGRIDDITDVHKHLNQFTSVAKVAIDKYTKDYIDPLLDNIANIARNTGLSEDNIIDYITAQSSLERENSGIQAFSKDKKEPWRKDVAVGFINDFQRAIYADRTAILQEQGSKALSETEKRILPKGLAEKLDSEGYAGLSGIEQAVLQDSPLNALWHSINAANDRILDILVEDSMITRETKERIKGHNWEYYVPLTGWDYNFKREDGSPYIYNPLEIYDFISPVSRFHINQVVKEATGRGKKPFNPIASMINIGIGAIITSKQNKAMQSVLRLARNNPHPDLYRINRVWLMKGPSGEWYETTIEPTFEQVENSKAARKELASLEMQMSLALMSGDEAQADSIMQKMVLVDALNTVKPADSLRSNFGMEAPVGQREQMQRYVECYINGVKHIVTFADPAVANAINTYNRLTIPRWVDNSIGDATRWLASAFTSRNPAFVSVNFLRDLQHAGLVHLLNHEGTLKDFALNVAPGMKAIIRNVRGKARPLTLAELKKRNILDYRQWGELASEFGSDRVWDTLYDYFRESGGETGFVHSKEVMQVEREIRRYVAIRTRRVKELMQVSDAREKANIALSYVGDRLGARKVARMFDNASKVAENTSRFATFVTSLAHNRTLLQAVDDAKNITVNFNRRGSASRGLGMFYVFFNASVQGAAQVGRIAWANKKRFKQMVAAMMAGGFLDAMLVDLFLGGQGDENEYYLSEWERSNHIIIPYVGRRGYIKIPLPQGFCAFHGIGVLFHDLCKGKINVEECSRSILSLLYENFSPVASPSSKGDLTRVVVPTALTPFYDVAVNEDAFGYPVGRRKYGQREYPLSEMGLKNVNKGIYYVCRGLNALGGGDEDTPAGMRKDGRIDPLLRGIFEWNPSHVEHVLTYYGGGIGKFSRDVVHTTQAIMDSETELSSHDLPIINRLFGIARKKSPAGEYFELRAKMENLAGVYKDKGYNGMNAEQVKLYRKYSAGISRLYKILGETHPGTPEYDKVREELDATMREYLKLNERYDTGN